MKKEGSQCASQPTFTAREAWRFSSRTTRNWPRPPPSLLFSNVGAHQTTSTRREGIIDSKHCRKTESDVEQACKQTCTADQACSRHASSHFSSFFLAVCYHHTVFIVPFRSFFFAHLTMNLLGQPRDYFALRGCLPEWPNVLKSTIEAKGVKENQIEISNKHYTGMFTRIVHLVCILITNKNGFIGGSST